MSKCAWWGGVHYTDGLPSDDQNKALRFNDAGDWVPVTVVQENL